MTVAEEQGLLRALAQGALAPCVAVDELRPSGIRHPPKMPMYSQHGEFSSVAYISGSNHVFLQVSFSPAPPVSGPSLVALPAVSAVPRRALDPPQIRQAVLGASTATNAELGTAFFPAVIRYVADDSPCYSLYALCTGLLIRRLASGASFARAPGVA